VAAASRLKRAFYRVMIISVVEPGSVPSSPTMTPGVTVLTVSTDDELVGGWNLEAFR
jgi:hypothetical protein